MTPAADLLIVGASESRLALLRTSLGGIAGPAIRSMPLDGVPDDGFWSGTAPSLVVVFAAGGPVAKDLVCRWLQAIDARRGVIVVGDDDAAPPALLRRSDAEWLPLRAADRLVPTIVRLLRDGRGNAPRWQQPLAYCDRLLRKTDPRQLCQTIADEIATAIPCQWSAVLHLGGQARVFDIAGSVGVVPAVLAATRGMTPPELAAALGWEVDGAPAQSARPSTGHPLNRLLRDGAGAAFAVIMDDRGIRGVALAGWPTTGPATAGVLRTMGEVCELGGAALRHTGLIADLRMSDQTKSEFVATMSHELRNPLAAILGYTDLLVHGDFGAVSEEQQEVLRRAGRSSRALLDLINATLDVSRFEVGDPVAASAHIDLRAVLREQIAEAAQRSDGVRITPYGESDALPLSTDPMRLGIALRQVLDAAIATNRGSHLRVESQRLHRGFTIEVAPVEMGPVMRGVPVLVELPQDSDSPGAPFSVFVAKRLLEILGGSLAVWRDDETKFVGFRMSIPELEP